MSVIFEAGEKVLLVDGKGRRYLITLAAGGAFHSHHGIVQHDAIIGQPEGTTVTSAGGQKFLVWMPTLEEFVLKMPRGAQVVYPKDLASIVLRGDVYPGAFVVEAGAGSGALTLALLRAVGPEGRVITYELREDFARLALANVEAFMGKAPNLEIRIGDIYESILDRGVDRLVLDVPEPWRVLPNAEISLREGGLMACYLPTVLQVHALAEAISRTPGWTPASTTETLVRGWHTDGQSVRPDHRMVAHTGFITTTRKLAG